MRINLTIIPHILHILKNTSLYISFIMFFLTTANVIVAESVYKYLYYNIEKIPYNKVGVVLGTSKYSRKGGLNNHYLLRIQTTLKLIKNKKIYYILISGDNATKNYNEPSTMRKDFISLKTPKKMIYRDYAGFRTFDSMIRAKKVFNLESFTIISQGYHNERAVYIARYLGINAIAFNAGDGLSINLENQIREFFAKAWMLIELYVLNTRSKFLGKSIKIGDSLPN